MYTFTPSELLRYLARREKHKFTFVANSIKIESPLLSPPRSPPRMSSLPLGHQPPAASQQDVDTTLRQAVAWPRLSQGSFVEK